MARFYGIKILNRGITIEDVPKLWKKATQQWIDANTN